MSAIHVGTCVARAGSAVDIELLPTTACGAHFPFSRFYGLALLYEAATTIVHYQGRTLWRGVEPAGSIAGELTFDELMELTSTNTPDEQLVRPPSPELRRALQERKRSVVDRFITAVSYVRVEGWRPIVCEPRLGRYTEGADGSHERFRQAEQALQDAFDHAPEDDPPTATLRVEATDLKWMSHIEPGMSWGVHCFDYDAALLL